ncbi:hypothetical protein BU16DRAFT_559109 [Lophium mytilinum]|uniref:Uncharacterized protein n=1 Tax=Lophium mytilinum TaxID=390894 RepID=A0A6A6QYP5_9PEZI|nr:hypothetical protein BU16DRAFT_559109 [Lophium mytilinum]
MMPKATQIMLILATTGFLASGMPTDAVTHISARQFQASPESPGCAQAGVYVCSDPYWQGNCVYHCGPFGSNPDTQCTKLDGSASSIGPDAGIKCNFFTNGYCDSLPGESQITLQYPGNDNLASIGWDNKVASYACFAL